MYVQVERYLGYACMQQKYFTKYIYVCLGSKIPWICMYIAKISHKTYICMFRQQDTLDMHVYSKNTSQNIYMYVQVARYLGCACIQQKYLTKIYTCLGSKIPHEKKKQKQTRKRNKHMIKRKREKRKISCLAEKPTCF